jgi:phage protein D
MAPDATNLDVQVTIGGKALAKNTIFDLEIRKQLEEPDQAVVSLANEAVSYSETIEVGDDIEIKMGLAGFSQAASAFKGEVVAVEPLWDTTLPRRVQVRALNKLHLLARGHKSVSYVNVTDKDIVDAVTSAHGLSANYGDAPPTTTHDHVYQHNQSDLELLRLRAARIGYELFVEDTTLYFRKPSFADSGIKLALGVEDSGLRVFRPRLSTTNLVGEVRVRGYDPKTKKELIGSAKPAGSPLGDKSGASKAKAVFFECSLPVASKAEADAVAAAILRERSLSYVTARAVTRGNPAIKLAQTITIAVADKRFDGKYYVVALLHRYVHGGKQTGFVTELTLRRDAVGDVQKAEEKQRAQAKPAASQPPPPSQPAKPPVVDWIEIRLIGEDGKPMSDVRYKLKLPDGDEREGTLDESGIIRAEGIDAGSCELTFPDLDSDAWESADD